MIIERTYDKELIERIATHPKIYKHGADDYSPSIEEYSAEVWVSNPHCIALVGWVEDNPVGAVLGHMRNGVTCEVHICVLPDYWSDSTLFAGDAVQWLFDNTGILKLVANIQANNMFAFKLARKVGFSLEGISRLSFLKNGILLDQYMFGLSKEDVCHKQQPQPQ